MTVLTRVPVERITARAREIHFWATLFTALGGLLYGIGWLTAKAFGLIWAAVTWVAAAVLIGWRDARPLKPKKPATS